MNTNMSKSGSADSALPPLSRFLDTTHSSFTECHLPSQYPNVPLPEFCESIVRTSKVQPTSVALSIHYMAKVIQNNVNVLQNQICHKCLFVACLVMSTENIQGQNCTADSIRASVGYMTLTQLHHIKTLVLQLLQYNVVVAPDILKVLEGCLDRDYIIKGWYWPANSPNMLDPPSAQDPEQTQYPRRPDHTANGFNTRQRLYSQPKNEYELDNTRQTPSSPDVLGYRGSANMQAINSTSALATRQKSLSRSGSSISFTIESILEMPSQVPFAKTIQTTPPMRQRRCHHPYSVRANML
ncbi:hypothetical protein SARC_02613 [Sphaeroforma arctica JP610]|uniref:Cyclin N-terminal domain-containing protein n=1 Tax=Sphaeroforma arctica JP610 TaxID=667725 RepID=A0A0L0G8G0_9EUKA|nr:hypothetical protein SARC_02613 [Sphaeroforma arctica JP610]KNC85194.1 hypothetical protein SARC_02613 [Sphaeroforma arctica JP610]|eukprot:XP_014159096.1 hypothetical protein SARC_02613 [Sphaeroforma arctica JP610]